MNPVHAQVVGELFTTTQRKLSLYLDAAAQLSWTMAGRTLEAAEMEELATDVLAVRDGATMFRGRIGDVTDTIDQDTHQVQVTALDYRGLLKRRLVLTPLSYANVEQSAVAWDLIQHAQSAPYGGMGITRGAVQAGGYGRDESYAVGAVIGDSITSLGDLQNGFEWEIDTDLRFNLWWAGARGSQVPQPYIYGTNVHKVTRTFASANMGNGVVATGTSGLAPVVLDPTAPDPGGRFDLAVSDPDITTTSYLTAYAQQAQADGVREAVASYAFDLEPGTEPPGLGDTVNLVVQSGRLDLDVELRVQQLDYAIGDSGDEVVTVTVGRLPGKIERRLASYDDRLAKLERVAGQ